MELRQKTGPTPKQNKYKNPAHVDRIFFYLIKGGLSQAQAKNIVQKRMKCVYSKPVRENPKMGWDLKGLMKSLQKPNGVIPINRR